MTPKITDVTFSSLITGMTSDGETEYVPICLTGELWINQENGPATPLNMST